MRLVGMHSIANRWDPSATDHPHVTPKTSLTDTILSLVEMACICGLLETGGRHGMRFVLSIGAE